MDRMIEIETMDLRELDEFSYVFIYVDIGKMPSNRVENYLKKVKESLSLCEKLDKMDVSYNLIPCRDKDNCHVSRAVMAEIGEKESQLELELEPIEDFGNKRGTLVKTLGTERLPDKKDSEIRVDFDDPVNKGKTLEDYSNKYSNFENAETVIDK